MTNESNLKEQIKSFIPRLEEMLVKEVTHIAWLKSQPQSDIIDDFIARGLLFRNHIIERLEQYKQYINE